MIALEMICNVTKHNDQIELPTRTNEFENFKFPEETRGQNLVGASNELESMERESREACDRMTVVFTFRSDESSSSVDVDDEFFNVTVDDVRSRLHDLKRVQDTDLPLMTREMRELDRDKRAMKYSKVVVRVSFKSGYMLQVRLASLFVSQTAQLLLIWVTF